MKRQSAVPQCMQEFFSLPEIILHTRVHQQSSAIISNHGQQWSQHGKLLQLWKSLSLGINCQTKQLCPASMDNPLSIPDAKYRRCILQSHPGESRADQNVLQFQICSQQTLLWETTDARGGDQLGALDRIFLEPCWCSCSKSTRVATGCPIQTKEEHALGTPPSVLSSLLNVLNKYFKFLF